MFCIYCGNKLDDDSVFCPKCGKRTGADGVKQADPPTVGESTSEPVEEVKPIVTEVSAKVEEAVSAVVAETEGTPSGTAERFQPSELGKDCKPKRSKILLALLIAELVTNPYWLTISSGEMFIIALLSPFPTCFAYMCFSRIYKFFERMNPRMSSASIAVFSEIIALLLAAALWGIYFVYYGLVGEFLA